MNEICEFIFLMKLVFVVKLSTVGAFFDLFMICLQMYFKWYFIDGAVD
jgi:hypothetical protein